MQNGAVLCALGFFLRSARAVVDVPALKQKATIRSKNIPAGKASRFIQVVIHSLSRLAILASHGRDCFVVCVVKFVNCTRAIGNSSSSSRARRPSRSARATAPGRAEREKPMSRRRLSIFEGAAACLGRRTLNAQPSTCNGQLKHRERAPHRWHAPNSQRSGQGRLKNAKIYVDRSRGWVVKSGGKWVKMD